MRQVISQTLSNSVGSIEHVLEQLEALARDDAADDYLKGHVNYRYWYQLMEEVGKNLQLARGTLLNMKTAIDRG